MASSHLLSSQLTPCKDSQDAPRLHGGSGQPQQSGLNQTRRKSRPERWADLDDESEDDLNSAASSFSFSSENFSFASDTNGSDSFQSGEQKALARRKGAKIRNMALPKHMVSSGTQSDASSMSEATSNTPRSGTGSTRSTRTPSESGETDGSYQNAGYSIGSALHDVDGCKPCLFVHTHVGCQNGSSCEFCHFVHKRKNKARPCKGKRERYRKLLIRLGEDAGDAGSACDASSDAGSVSASCASRDEICTTAQI